MTNGKPQYPKQQVTYWQAILDLVVELEHQDGHDAQDPSDYVHDLAAESHEYVKEQLAGFFVGPFNVLPLDQSALTQKQREEILMAHFNLFLESADRITTIEALMDAGDNRTLNLRSSDEDLVAAWASIGYTELPEESVE